MGDFYTYRGTQGMGKEKKRNGKKKLKKAKGTVEAKEEEEEGK